jgi:hypothetical protein
VFVRAHAAPDGGTVVDIGGLARSDAAGGFETEFASLAAEIMASHGGRQPAGTAAAGSADDGGSENARYGDDAGYDDDPADNYLSAPADNESALGHDEGE